MSNEDVTRQKTGHDSRDEESREENRQKGAFENAPSGFDGYEEAASRDEVPRGEEEARSDEELILEQQKRIEELQHQVKEFRDTSLRRAAELDNMKKRFQREKTAIFEQAKAESLEQFLPINDDLQRTLQALDEVQDERLQGVLKGVRMVADKFEEVLEKYDVRRIDQTGVPFDVDLHDALMRKKVDDDEIESDTVLEVLESGYRVGDRTIRYAKVVVSE